jgi:hypothetical protein
LGPPSVADGHHLNRVRTPADSLFETMSNHSVLGWRTGRLILRRARNGSSEARREGACTRRPKAALRRRAMRKYSSWRVLNSFSTGHPQVLHSVLDPQSLHAAESTIGGLPACA